MSPLSWAHPLVAEWFVNKFGTPTEPQELGWPHILAGRTTLISAPTGSGKTLAAFLACIDRLVRKAIAGTLRDRTEVLYISPLKALGNDIQKNLEAPLREILELAAARGYIAGTRQSDLTFDAEDAEENKKKSSASSASKPRSSKPTDEPLIRTAVRTGDTLMHERRAMLRRP